MGLLDETYRPRLDYFLWSTPSLSGQPLRCRHELPGYLTSAQTSGVIRIVPPRP